MLPILLLLAPLALALTALFIKNPNLSKTFIYFSAVSLVVLAGVVLYAVQANLPVLDFDKVWLKSFNVRFHLGLDGLSALFSVMALAVGALVLIASMSFDLSKRYLHTALVLFTVTSLLGLFMSKDAFLFYFFFEIALLPVYLIANIWGRADSSRITFKMLVYTVFGSLLMLVAFVLLYMRSQSSDLGSLAQTASLVPSSIKNLLFIAFLIAFAIKTPIFPMHTWLPDAYAKSPSSAVMLLSGLLSKMGIYGILRVLMPLATEKLNLYAHIIITLAIIGLIYGAILAIKQNNFKSVLAYSSFSHMGLMAAACLTMSTSGISGAILQVLAHAFSAVGLFYIAKIVYERTSERNIMNLGGLVHQAPNLAICFLIILLSSVALPLTNAFVGEFLMLKSIYDFNTGLGIFAGLSVIFGAVYMLRAYQHVMFGEVKGKAIKDLNTTELLVLIPIVVVILFFGLFPQPIIDLTSDFVTGTLNK
jgi:NADH-quinone oxidoreductase subunit M